MLYLNKTRKTSGNHYFKPVYQNSWHDYSSSDIEHDRLKFVILDHFLHFWPLKNQKIWILKKWKNHWRYHHCTHISTKNQFLRYSEMDRIFCHFWPFFALTTWKPKFLIMTKGTWRCHHFKHLYHQWRSYDVSGLSMNILHSGDKLPMQRDFFKIVWTTYCLP